MTTTATGGQTKHDMGFVEANVRKFVEPGMMLGTVPRRASFEVLELAADDIVLLFGKKKTRTVISWSCLEKTMQFMAHRDWIEIRSVHDTTGVPGSLDGYIKSNGGPKRTVGGYVAAILEAAGIVDVDTHSPAKIRLRESIADRRRSPEANCIRDTSRSDPFSRVFGALEGTVTITSGTDLTAPAGEEWDAAR